MIISVDRRIIDYGNDKVEVFGNFYLYQGQIYYGKNLIGDTKLNNFSAIDVSYIYNNDLKIDLINQRDQIILYPFTIIFSHHVN